MDSWVGNGMFEVRVGHSSEFVRGDEPVLGAFHSGFRWSRFAARNGQKNDSFLLFAGQVFVLVSSGCTTYSFLIVPIRPMNSPPRLKHNHAQSLNNTESSWLLSYPNV